MARFFTPVRWSPRGSSSWPSSPSSTSSRRTSTSSCLTAPGRGAASSTSRASAPTTNGGGIYYVAVEFKQGQHPRGADSRDPRGLDPGRRRPGRAPGETEEQHRAPRLASMTLSQEVGAAVALQARSGIGSRSSRRSMVIEVDGPEASSARKVAATRTSSSAWTATRREVPDESVGRSSRERPGGGRPSVAEARKSNNRPSRSAPRRTGPINRPLIGVSQRAGGQVARSGPHRPRTGRRPVRRARLRPRRRRGVGRDVDRGYKVAASGEICADGTVVPVGGLKQKTIGARRAGIDVFLVPAGENAAEARRYAGGMRVIPVHSFRQALHALATLPPKQPKA